MQDLLSVVPAHTNHSTKWSEDLVHNQTMQDLLSVVPTHTNHSTAWSEDLVHNQTMQDLLSVVPAHTTTQPNGQKITMSSVWKLIQPFVVF